MALKTTDLSIPVPSRLSREDAVELLAKAIESYLHESYNGGQDHKGLILELRYNILPKGVGAIFDWFLNALGADVDDLLILLLVAWTEPIDSDYDWSTDINNHSKDWNE